MIENIEIDFSGKTALVTGGTRGIGKSIAKSFIKHGAMVISTGTSQKDLKNSNKDDSEHEIDWIHGNFSTKKGIELFMQSIEERDIDICINNAGINNIKPFTDYSSSDYEKLMNVNLAAPFEITKRIISKMKKKQFGRIVNIASIWSEISKSHRSLYSISKTGIVGFSRALAIENAPHNILINAVSPGFTLTEMTKQSLTSDEINKIKSQIPLNRLAEPQDIANIVLFLCSDFNTYITGQNIVIDGGFTIV